MSGESLVTLKSQVCRLSISNLNGFCNVKYYPCLQIKIHNPHKPPSLPRVMACAGSRVCFLVKHMVSFMLVLREKACPRSTESESFFLSCTQACVCSHVSSLTHLHTHIHVYVHTHAYMNTSIHTLIIKELI